MIPLSVLDLAPIIQGATAADAFRNTLDLAQHAERWGYHRFWLAEHHNMPGIASAATAVVIGHVAGGKLRARNVLQHGVGSWVDRCDFSGLEDEKLRARAEAMRARLVKLGRESGDVGYSLTG